MNRELQTELGPYEKQVVRLLEDNGKMKFGHIIMRMGISARHGQRLIDSLKKRGMLIYLEDTRYFTIPNS